MINKKPKYVALGKSINLKGKKGLAAEQAILEAEQQLLMDFANLLYEEKFISISSKYDGEGNDERTIYASIRALQEPYVYDASIRYS